MRKNLYNVTIDVEMTAKFESLLNAFRIGLNEWDRSRVFNIDGRNVVVYTVMCYEENLTGLMSYMTR